MAHSFYQSAEQSTDKKAIFALDCPSGAPHISTVRSRFVLLQDFGDMRKESQRLVNLVLVLGCVL